MARRSLPVLPEGFADPKLPRGTFSASQYGLYKKCPKAYEFSYVDGIKNPPSGIQLTGTTIHLGAETAHKHLMETQTPPTVEAVKAAMSDHFDVEQEAVASWEEGLDAGKTKDKAMRGYETYHAKALPTVRPMAAEQGFVKKIGVVPMTGFIDLIDAPKPGQLVVADLKHGSASWSQDDVNKDPQFTIYSIVTGIGQVRVDNLVFKKAGPDFSQKTAPRDAQAQRILVEDLEETVDLVKRGVFPKTSIDSWACSEKWCGYWTMCRGRQY